VFRRALTRYPDTQYLLVNCGRLAGELDPALASECYRRLVDLWPERIDYRLAHAQALEAQGRDEEAARAYAEVVRRDPENAEAVESMVRLAARAGDREQAGYWLGKLELVDTGRFERLGSSPELRELGVEATKGGGTDGSPP